MKIEKLLVVWAASCVAALASAHEQPAHYRLTFDAIPEAPRFARAMEQLDLANRDLPVVPGLDFLTAAAPVAENFGFGNRHPTSFVLAGTVLEDGVGFDPRTVMGGCNVFPGAPLICNVPRFDEFVISRCANHFQDIEGEGMHGAAVLFMAQVAAQRWAYDGGGKPNGHTWLAACDNYTAAFTAHDSASRDVALQRALVAIGCNLHLLQDQTSPAHTRNDPHPGHGVPFVEFLQGSSLLEQNGLLYLNPMFPAGNPFHPGVVGLPTVNSHKELFDNLVHWTSTHFFSDGTFFNNLLVPFEHPSREDFFEREVGCIPSSANYRLEELVSQSADTPGCVLGTKKTTFWMDGFDEVYYSLYGPPCGAEEGSAHVDEVIYDNLRHLVPVAIGHSAALLDYFFRGELECAQRGDVLSVTNISSQDGEGDDPLSIEGGQLLVVLAKSNGAHEVVATLDRPFDDVSVGQAIDIAVPADRIPIEDAPNGVATLYVVVEDARIGLHKTRDDELDPGVAVHRFEWRRESDVCGEPCELAGYSLVALGDVNGDGNPELVKGGASFVEAFTRTTCTRQWRYAGNPQSQLVRGYLLGQLGDVDGDGVCDVVTVQVDAPFSPSVRYSFVGLSGATGRVLWTTLVPSGYLPTGIEALHDAVGGLSGYFLGTWDDGPHNWRVLYTSSGAVISDPMPDAPLGPDMDNDGFEDLYLGGTYIISLMTGESLYDPLADWDPRSGEPAPLITSNTILLRSALGPMFIGRDSDGRWIGHRPNATEPQFVLDHVIASPAGRVGDVDGDGSEDFVGWRYPGSSETVICNGGNGAVIREAPSGDFTSGWGVRRIGDLDKNGDEELLWISSCVYLTD